MIFTAILIIVINLIIKTSMYASSVFCDKCVYESNCLKKKSVRERETEFGYWPVSLYNNNCSVTADI